MTKAQIRTKFKKLQKENRKIENNLLEKALKCGTLDLKSYKDDFMAPKMIMHAICLRLSDSWIPFTNKTKEDAEKLKFYI